MSEDELQRVWILRKLLHDMDDIAAIEFILDKLKETKTNSEFLTQCVAKDCACVKYCSALCSSPRACQTPPRCWYIRALSGSFVLNAFSAVSK